MKSARYVAKIPDNNGFVSYSHSENQVWQELYERQIVVIENRACDEYVAGVKKLALSADAIPQLPDICDKLGKLTGWAVSPVKALISFKEFFTLLANKKFPVATFIRRPEDLDYLPEPDIFHEIFGHCPLLTNQHFANFTHRVGEIGLAMTQKQRVMLARLYWFTVEFGLINTSSGLRIYGGGILSSKDETIYALESPIPARHQFDLIQVLRTQYRYDELQKNYFIINSLEKLFELVSKDLAHEFERAQELGVITEEEPDMRSC